MPSCSLSAPPNHSLPPVIPAPHLPPDMTHSLKSFIHSFLTKKTAFISVPFCKKVSVFVAKTVAVKSLMAYSISPFLIFLTTIFMIFSSSSSLNSDKNLPASTISAAPALLPSPLSSPPALSPDINPLFPSPGGPELSPTESSLPIIPSSPSPPNPDDNTVVALGPVVAFAPSSGLLPDSSSLRLNVGVFLSSIVVSGLVASGLLQLSG